MEYVLANLEGSNFKNFPKEAPPWLGPTGRRVFLLTMITLTTWILAIL